MEQFVSKPSHAGPHPKPEQLFSTFNVNQVSTSSISKWLRQGLDDMKANPVASLTYGVIFAVFGMVMSYLAAANPAFVLATTTGFLLLGPFLALGLYDLSRRREEGHQPSFIHSAKAMNRNLVSFGIYAVALGFLMVFWIRTAAVVTGIFFSDTVLPADGYSGIVSGLLSMDQSASFVVVFLAVGFLFAYAAFITGVVTVPMLLDKKVDIVTAISTSVKAVWKNHLTLLIWAAVITAIIGIGILPYYLGLIVAMPLVAHASWHAYRDLVSHNKK